MGHVRTIPCTWRLRFSHRLGAHQFGCNVVNVRKLVKKEKVRLYYVIEDTKLVGAPIPAIWPTFSLFTSLST